MKTKFLMTAAAAAALAAGLASAQTTAAPSNAAAKPPVQAPAASGAARVVAKGDIIDTARASGQFNTFLKAVDATNLTAVLKNNKNLTVFAPTDAAFASLPAGELDRLMADRPQLQKLLTHHVVNARIESSKIKNARGAVTTVAGDQLQLDGSGDTLLAGDADIVQPDVMASNGILHVVDKVIMPGAQAAGSNAAAASATAPQQTVAPAAQPKDAPPSPAQKK